MYRPFGAAIFAVVLAAAFGGTANAEPSTASAPAGSTSSAALEAGSIAASADHSVASADESIAPAQPVEPYTVSPQARAALEQLEAKATPEADADLSMWSGGHSAVGPAAASKKGSHPASADPIHRFARGILSRTSSIAMSLTRSAMRFIGTPYVFGGTSPSGFDCSGYTQHVFAMLGIRLPRTADAQYDAGRRATGGVTTGDLVFFQTYEPGPSHVGIYVGSGKFIHSSSHGVMVSRLRDSYWSSRYLGAKRVASFH